MVKAVKGLPAEWGKCSRTVQLNGYTSTLSYHNNTIAVGSEFGDITTLDAITGSKTAVLSGHTMKVYCLIFSPDGTSLVSGSDDQTVKLWDLQTGGVVKTFSGHTDGVLSVSISTDLATIASGSEDRTICLWNIQTEECYKTIQQQDFVYKVCFSPTNPQCLLSVSGGKVWQWDTNGCQIKPPCNGSGIAFSSDGTQFVSSNEEAVTVQNSDSGVIVTEFCVENGTAKHCCFSPNDRLVAVAVGSTVYVFDITSSDPHLIETFIGHTYPITSLVFSSLSTLISASKDDSVKFWQIGVPSTAPDMADPESISPTSRPIRSITLQTKDGIAITIDSGGMVKTWDISTGLCKASFQIPAKSIIKGDAQLINGRLIVVWNTGGKICMWDAEKGEPPSERYVLFYPEDLRISEDGSKIFLLYPRSIEAWSVQTGEVVGKVEVRLQYTGSLIVDGLKVWAYWPQSECQGWDFGIPGSLPAQLSTIPTLPPKSSMLWNPSLSMIKDAVTGKVLFQLSGRFANPTSVQCDGYYLVAGYESGEILILELNHVLSQ